jgi:hypothetical protein
LKHVVAVHCGDPQNGLHRVDVGAPFADDVNGWEWEWVDALSELEPYQEEGDGEGELGSDAMDDEDDEDCATTLRTTSAEISQGKREPRRAERGRAF